jgi:hypothetical protein
MKIQVLHFVDRREDFDVDMDAADQEADVLPILAARKPFIATIGDAVGDKLTIKTERKE